LIGSPRDIVVVVAVVVFAADELNDRNSKAMTF
jgi:hypothetical protein